MFYEAVLVIYPAIPFGVCVAFKMDVLLNASLIRLDGKVILF